MIGGRGLPAGAALAELAARPPEVLVIGAGPAGSLAARQLALAGVRVWLVEKAAFPRDKVCGCCLNPEAVGVLQRVGLGDLPRRLGARPLERLELACGGARASLPLSGGVALSRAVLDAALAGEAVGAGARFLGSTLATVGPATARACRVRLRNGEDSVEVFCQAVIAADGLAGTALGQLGDLAPRIGVDSRVGAGVLVDHALPEYPAGAVFMACGRGGYVGVVRVEDGRLDVAAAFDPAVLREGGGPGPVAAGILEGAGFAAIPAMMDAHWRGTPALTRRRAVEHDGVFVIGDAAGYVEPFTGEGMAWALASAEAVVPIVVSAVRGGGARGWAERHRALVARRQRVCAATAWILRRPGLTRVAIRVLASVPGLAWPVIRTTGRPWTARAGLVPSAGVGP